MVFEIEDELLLLDEVEGKNIEELAKALNLTGKRIMNRVSDEVKSSPVFIQMHKLKVGTSIARYEPFSLIFADGQILTALVENKRKRENEKKPVLTRAVKVSEWFLNKRRITQYVYMKEGSTGQNRGVSDAEVALNIGNLVMKSHERLNGKILETPFQIRKRIKAINIDVSRTVASPYEPTLKEILDVVEKPTIKSMEQIKEKIELIESHEVKSVVNNPIYTKIIDLLDKMDGIIYKNI